MRIALLQFYSKNPTPVYDELARVFRSKGHTVCVATPDDRGDLAWRDGERILHRTPGPGRCLLPGLRFAERRLRQLLFMLRVRRDLARLRPDIAQVNKSTYAGLIPRAMPSSMRFIYDVRQPGLWGSNTRRGRAANRRVIRRIRRNARSGFHLACLASEAAAVRVLGPDWKRWAVITPIGVDPAFVTFRLPPPPRRRDETRVSFIYVGSLLKGKQLGTLLLAAAELARTTRRFRLILVGAGDGVEEYRRAAAGLGLDGLVEFRSPVPYRDVPDVITGHDVALAFVPPIEDWQYQVTLKVLEYRALGVPIIASDLPPNREVVKDAVNGIIAPSTATGFASAMQRFIDDPDFLASCSVHAAAMREGRTWEEVARIHLEEVYARVAPHRN